MILVRAVFHQEPEGMTDEALAKRMSEAMWYKQFELEMMEAAMLGAIAKAFNGGWDTQE